VPRARDGLAKPIQQMRYAVFRQGSRSTGYK
jgi:hypothetical protein